jgi:hypothetical protein
MKALVLCAATGAAGLAAAAEPATHPSAVAGEPSVRELQQIAVRVAELHPGRAASLLRRAGNAAWLPSLHFRVGRGSGDLTRDSNDRYYLTTTNSWHFDFEASWALDRLVFDRNELRVSREGQRLAARREQIQTRVAQLYFARRRLQLDALAQPDSATANERALEIEELTALLDGLTDGALTGGGK